MRSFLWFCVASSLCKSVIKILLMDKPECTIVAILSCRSTPQFLYPWFLSGNVRDQRQRTTLRYGVRTYHVIPFLIHHADIRSPHQQPTNLGARRLLLIRMIPPTEVLKWIFQSLTLGGSMECSIAWISSRESANLSAKTFRMLLSSSDIFAVRLDFKSLSKAVFIHSR